MLPRLPYSATFAVEWEMLFCRGRPSHLPGLVEVRSGFPSALTLLKCVARQDTSPEACAVCGSNKHNSRVGEGEVHLHLDFLLFTK